MMKTFEQVMTEVANKHSYSTWGEMMHDTHEHSQIEYTAEAMREYASQAIDRCAAKSFRKNIEVAGGNEIWEIVRKEEILKVKNELL